MVLIFLAIQRSKVSRGSCRLLVCIQPDFHLLVLHDFLKHKINSMKILRNGLFPIQPNSRAREVLFRLQSDFVNTCEAHRTVLHKPNKQKLLSSILILQTPQQRTKGLHLLSNDIYLYHSTSANHSQGSRPTLMTPNGPFQNLPSHTLTTISFPSTVCTPFLYSYCSSQF